jgi:hypothetical protein
MKRITTGVCAVGFAVASWLAAGNAFADDKGDKPEKGASQPMELAAKKLTASGTIQKIDTGARELTLKMDDGSDLMVKVPESVPKFDEFKKNDHVSVEYYESVALSLKKQGGEAGSTQSKTVVKGKLPGGIVAKQLTASVEIAKIEGSKLTIKRPDGKMETIDVTDDSLKSDLSKMKEGDKISVTYTEAVAVMVTKDEKSK